MVKNYTIRLMNLRNNIFLILISFISFSTVFGQKSNVYNDFLISKKINLALSKIQVIPISDTTTKRTYELYIKLPDDYSKNDETNYPVLYFTYSMWHI